MLRLLWTFVCCWEIECFRDWEGRREGWGFGGWGEDVVGWGEDGVGGGGKMEV